MYRAADWFINGIALAVIVISAPLWLPFFILIDLLARLIGAAGVRMTLSIIAAGICLIVAVIVALSWASSPIHIWLWR